MPSRGEMTLPATQRRSRKSLTHVPSLQTMDQENMTTDLRALATGKRSAPIEKPMRKSRSKSIGPGGLDAIKDTNGNRRKSLAAIPNPPPRSILKPAIPPLREIPAHISKRKGSQMTTPLPTKEDGLIDFDLNPTPVAGADNLLNLFQAEGSAAVGETRVTLRTEEEQQAAAREREEKERGELQQEVISRRDARRKSLVNRRVSFAPEATLHTWDVVVEYQDSTTSSNGTRRASSASGGSVGSPHPNALGLPISNPYPSDPPSTPPKQVEDEALGGGNEHQRGLHQKKRRRSSGIPPMNFNNPDDEFMSSSPFSGDSAGDEEVVDEDDASNSNSDSGDDDGTLMMILDEGETTNMSMASVRSNSTSGSNGRLDEALREAARQAGTQGIDFDEYGDTKLSEEEGVVASFTPWSKKNPMEDLESREDQENINPFSLDTPSRAPAQEDRSDGEEMTMDMTHAIGGILPSPQQQQPEDDEMSMDVTRAFGTIIHNEVPKAITMQKSMAIGRRQSTRRRSFAEELSIGDETMDLTKAVGSIQQAREDTISQNDEDMTMEFTSVVGGVLPQINSPLKNRRRSSIGGNQKTQRKRGRESLDSNAGDETMDMTMAMGGIMSSIVETPAGDEDETIGMEMTTAIGSISQPQRSTERRSHAKKIMEMETDFGSSPFQAEVVAISPSKVTTHTITSDTGSPSLSGFRGNGLRRSNEARNSTTPKTRLSNSSTPTKKPTTPSKQLTPQLVRPTTPGKTPPSKNVSMRTSSPKRLFKDEPKVTTPQSGRSKRATTPIKLFLRDKNTGAATPNFILTPQPRRSSGLGLDKVGLGSPRLVAILDRRQSIGEHAKSFVPSLTEDASHGVRFINPHALESEIDNERQQEEDRENGRKILEREAEQGEGDKEKDVTLNLKDLIQSMTPKKKSLKGRKSLHVGAAKGILGKRPVELDEDDEDADIGGMKRLKGHQSSPVKNVKLQGPPSKDETTTGRMTRATRRSLEQVNTSHVSPTTSSPSRAKVRTPRIQGRFRDTEVNAPTEPVIPPEEKELVEDPQVDEESFDDDRIQLQDFLNMTNIRFMELTTTKRRHTIAPKASAKDLGDEKPVSLEDCVAAGAATIPMLELFQHACQELKKYISEGRKTVREIETETFEENPPLFREYISAAPDMKIFMDNQLKNVKTYARLLSKEMWYEWRLTLLGTLKDGLFKSAEGMISDEERLDEQQALIESVLPRLIQQAEDLQREEYDYQLAAEELASCDPEELSDARQRLTTADADIEAKKKLIADLRKQLQGKEAEIESGAERKQLCLEEIKEAEKIREECRGWSSTEIRVIKDKVDEIETQRGWTITGVSGTTTSMTYHKEIELVFDASSFLSNISTAKQPQNSRIDLWYIGHNREMNSLPLTPEKEFCLQSIRDHIRGLPQAEMPVKDLLQAVSQAWNKAASLVDDIRSLNISCPTEITKTSDNSICVKSSLLIGPLATKVEICFYLTSQSNERSFDVVIEPKATVCYGERFNEPKMGEFLLNRCGNKVIEKGKDADRVAWGEAVAELGEKLLARGRK